LLQEDPRLPRLGNESVCFLWASVTQKIENCATVRAHLYMVWLAWDLREFEITKNKSSAIRIETVLDYVAISDCCFHKVCG
jgi:predicted DNA-binding transcriptional regulator AlpA